MEKVGAYDAEAAAAYHAEAGDPTLSTSETLHDVVYEPRASLSSRSSASLEQQQQDGERGLVGKGNGARDTPPGGNKTRFRSKCI